MGHPQAIDPVLLTPPLSDGELPAGEGVSLRFAAKDASAVYFERKMGDTELSYFLPSRQSGVNDMCVCPCRPAHPAKLTAISPGICTSASMPRRTSWRAAGCGQCGPSCACGTPCSPRRRRCTTMTTCASCECPGAPSVTGSRLLTAPVLQLPRARVCR